MFYLTQELSVPSRARATRLPERGGSSQEEDSAEGYKEEDLKGHGEKPPAPAEQPGNSPQHLSPPVEAAVGGSSLTTPCTC